jgi:RNA polymerase sigma-70 factor, ECF subfamily
MPPDELLAERTAGVLAVLYLIFNEGYGRREDHLAVEALRLARLLVDLMPGDDEARGLLALIALQLSWRTTRFDARGELVPLEEQDRGRWDAALIEEGRRQLRRATGSGRPPGPYRLQAEIAACHAAGRGGHRLGQDRHPVRRPARRPAVTRRRPEPGHRRRLPRRLGGRPGGP